MPITSVIDPVAGSENASIDGGIRGALQDSKTIDTIISEDIGQLLPTEVSSADSDNCDDDEDNDGENENDNLLDEITEEDIKKSAGITEGESSTPTEVHHLPAAEQEKKVSSEIESKAANSQQQCQATGKPGVGAKSSATDHATEKEGSPSTSFRGRPSSCVFVASLAASLSDDELCISVTESFKQYGQLARVKVLRDPSNRPYAFVQYTNDRDAKRALKMARGSVLNGRTLRCESARVNRTLFVTHVSPILYLQVADMCEKFGELEQLVPSSDHNQLSKKYTYPPSNHTAWFAQFAYRDDAIRAFANLRTNADWDVEWVQNIEVPRYFNLLTKRNTKERNADGSAENNEGDDEHNEGEGKGCDADDDDEDEEEDEGSQNGIGSNRYRQHRHGGGDRESKGVGSERVENHVVIDKRSIFVGQLDQSVTKERLNERFSTHGKISDVSLINKINKVFAFIQFETEEAAAAALERENHAIFLNKTMHVQYKEVGGHRGRRNFRKNGNGNNNNNNNNNGGFYGGGNDRNGDGNGGRTFTGPQVNLAPPPINMYRRRSQENDTMGSPYMGPTSEFDMNYVPFMNGPFRRKSFVNGWSSSRSHSMKSEVDTICGDAATDATSEASESAGQANPAITYNNSSAGSTGHNNSNSYNHHNNVNGGNNSGHFNSGGKKRYGKRGNNGSYNDAPKPYYFQPYYYHPMHYPMGPMGPVAPAHPSQAPGGNHPYMMIYPMPPPPHSGVDGNILAQHLQVGPPGSVLHGSPLTAQSQGVHSDANEFEPNTKPCQLDY